MNHDEIREKVLLLRDGNLPGPERAEIDNHLKGCPPCRKTAADLERVGALITSQPEPDPSENFVNAVMGRIEEGDARIGGLGTIELPFRWWAPAFAVGMAALALVALPALEEPRGPVEALLTSAARSELIEASDIEEMLGVDLGGP
ncbi:MAG: zf-HC2 domain-containing protein [SAR324 cluster bacterium]|nr:zf-HC2 domain-containing protein [SAR324 cluster bacterium]